MSRHACTCSHMCVRRLHRAFSADSLLKHTVQSGADGWHMWPEFPACTMTQEFTLRFHRALPSTAALLTRAQRFNYWPVPALKPHQLSHTGNCLSQCKGGNWIAGLWGKMYTHCSCARLIMLWIVGRLHNGKLEAYASSAGYSFYIKNFLIEVVCFGHGAGVFSSGSEGRLAVTGAMSKTFLAVFTVKKWAQESLNHILSISGPSVSFLSPLSPCLVVSQAEVVQLPLLSLLYP